jgi:hypothetical protein
MTPSTFIARILGPVLIVIGLGLLLQTESFRAMGVEFLKSGALIYFSGLITIAVGLAILNVHNLWVRDWRVIITIFGWLSLIGGIFRILATTWVQQSGLSMMTHPRGLIVVAVAELLLGGYLSIMGYQDIWNEVVRGKPQRAPATHRVPATQRAAKASRAPARTPKRTRQKSR